MSQSLVLGYSRSLQNRSSFKCHTLKNKLPESVDRSAVITMPLSDSEHNIVQLLFSYLEKSVV